MKSQLQNNHNCIDDYEYREASVHDVYAIGRVWVEKLFTFFYFPKKEKR
jgi:hypothetical protein